MTDELRKLYDAATPAPWAAIPKHWQAMAVRTLVMPPEGMEPLAIIERDNHRADAAFIVALVNAYAAGELVAATTPATAPVGDDASREALDIDFDIAHEAMLRRSSNPHAGPLSKRTEEGWAALKRIRAALTTDRARMEALDDGAVWEATQHLARFVNDNRPRHWKVMQIECALAAKDLATLTAALTTDRARMEAVVHEATELREAVEDAIRNQATVFQRSGATTLAHLDDCAQRTYRALAALGAHQ